MASSPSQRFPLAILPLLFLSLAVPPAGPVFAASGPVAQDSTNAQPPAGWKTYRAANVPFEFSYPEDFLLEAHVNAKLGFIFALIKKPGTPWLVDIDFADRASFPMELRSTISLEEFAIERAEAGCDADGPDGSVSCPTVARKSKVKNRNGLEVVELYLNQVNRSYDPPKTTKSVIGPIEAVLLPTGNSARVLTFKRADTDDATLVSDDLLRQIAQSVKPAR